MSNNSDFGVKNNVNTAKTKLLINIDLRRVAFVVDLKLHLQSNESKPF